MRVPRSARPIRPRAEKHRAACPGRDLEQPRVELTATETCSKAYLFHLLTRASCIKAVKQQAQLLGLAQQQEACSIMRLYKDAPCPCCRAVLSPCHVLPVPAAPARQVSKHACNTGRKMCDGPHMKRASCCSGSFDSVNGSRSHPVSLFSARCCPIDSVLAGCQFPQLFQCQPDCSSLTAALLSLPQQLPSG